MQFIRPSLVLILALAQSSQGWYSSHKTCTWNFRSNPDDCGTYFQCNFGKPLLRQCPPGLHWNSRVNTCDWTKSAKCTTKAEQQGTNFIERDDTKCDGQVQYKPDPQDCTKYYWCVMGEWLSQQCNPTLTFNAGISMCDWPENSKCTAAGDPTTPPTTSEPPTPPPTSEEPTTPTTSEQPTIPTTSEQPTTPTTSEQPTTPTTSPPDGVITPAGDYKVICYYTGWSTYRQGDGKFKPSDVDDSLCTHIVYAFAVLDTNLWTIRIADPWMDIDNNYYKQITSLKKKGKKVTIAVGGWNDSQGSRWSDMLKEPSRLSTFIQSVAAFVKKYNFDGIDLDYEYPVCPWGECAPQYQTDKSGFTALVIGLRNELPRPSYIVSAAVSCNKVIIDAGYDVSTISKYLDWIGVMAYDIHGVWDKRTGHIAPMYAHPNDTHSYLNVHSAIQHWMSRGADPSKLILGIPMYGNSFTLSQPSTDSGMFAPITGTGERGEFTNQGGILASYEICSQEWEKQVDDPDGRMGPYVVDGNQWVSYDDTPAILRKTEYVKANKLGGAMIWSLDFDDFHNVCGQGKYPMLKTIHSSLQGSQTASSPQRRRSAKGSFKY